MNNDSQKTMVGAIEVCDLPELDIHGLHIRVDTGAATSSLHVDNIEEFKKGKERWVRFDLHPDIHNVSKIVRREAKQVDIRNVKSSSGERQKRYVIETAMVLAGQQWDVYITLSDRSSMTYLMLLGRQAMKDRLVVDPSSEFLLGQPSA